MQTEYNIELRKYFSPNLIPNPCFKFLDFLQHKHTPKNIFMVSETRHFKRTAKTPVGDDSFKLTIVFSMLLLRKQEVSFKAEKQLKQEYRIAEG